MKEKDKGGKENGQNDEEVNWNIIRFCTFFAGLSLRVLISPAKQGFGNTTNYYGNKKEDSEIEEASLPKEP